MSSSPNPTNPIARIFKFEPYRDLFRTLADSLESALLVLSEDGSRLLTANHAFLLLTGYARSELDGLPPSMLFAGDAGEQALARILSDREGGEFQMQDVPLLDRAGETRLVDLTARAAGRALLLSAVPSIERQRLALLEQAQAERLSGLTALAESLLEGDASNIGSALDIARRMLCASHLALYRVSPTGPGYQLDGDLPAEFPRSLEASSFKPLPRSSRWELGQRPQHALHKAARSADIAILRTTSLGTAKAWVGLLVASWRAADTEPADADDLLRVIANLCHAAIQMSQQHASVAELETAVNALEAQIQAQFEASAEGMLAIDESLAILEANPAAARLLGYRQDELRGQSLRDVLVGPEDVMTTVLDALGHDHVAERPRLTIHRRDGTPFPVHLRAAPIAQGPVRLLIAFGDRSEQQAMEDET